MGVCSAELAQTELFRDAPEAVLLKVIEHAEPVRLAAGDVLLMPERLNQHVYVLLSGRLSLHFEAVDSPEVRELSAGVSVGEISAIDDTLPSAYVIAKEPCRVLPIHRDLLQQLIEDSHPVARNMLRLMGQWIKANTRHIANDQSQIQRLSATIRHVSAQGLDRRIPSGPEDKDFAELIAVFNEMLERLERSFKQASRFSGDAAHELKTPLAILQGQIEQAINQAEAGSSFQIMLTGILDEVRRLTSISKRLLLLSQADAGRLRLHRTPFNLSASLRDIVEDARMLAPHLQVHADIATEIILEVDAELLRQALLNLLSNAIKYNIEGGWIRFSTSQWDGRVEVCVTNTSLAISIADRAMLFERFYRADPAHSRKIEGAGLGLSLAREIVRAHGGDLLLAESPEGEAHFCLSLPC